MGEEGIEKRIRGHRVLLLIGLGLLALSLGGLVLAYLRRPSPSTLILDVSRERSGRDTPGAITGFGYTSSVSTTWESLAHRYSPIPGLVYSGVSTDPLTKGLTSTLNHYYASEPVVDLDLWQPITTPLWMGGSYSSTDEFEAELTLGPSPVITGQAPILTVSPTAAVSDGVVVITFTVSNVEPAGGSPITITAITARLGGVPIVVNGTDRDQQLGPGESWRYLITHTIRPRYTFSSTVIVTGTAQGADILTASQVFTVHVSVLGTDPVNASAMDYQYTPFERGHYYVAWYDWDYRSNFARVGTYWDRVAALEQRVEVIEVEWPEKAEVNRSDSVRIAFVQTESGEYYAALERDGNRILSTTPIPAGTPEAPLDEAFGLDYEGFARADLVGTTFDIKAVGSREQSLAQRKITWKWNVVSDKPGRQVLDAIIEVEWRPKKGGEPIVRQAWQQSLDVWVEKPWIGTNQLLLFSVMGLMVGSGFSAPWLYQKVRKRRRERTHEAALQRVMGEGYDLAALRRIVTERFSLAEVRTLCFDLGVDFDSLPGEGKAEKVRELVDYMARRESLEELLVAIQRTRPELIGSEET